MPASLASIRCQRSVDRCRRRADRPTALAERFEWNPPRRIRVACSVLVDGRADLLRSRSQIADERLHLRIAVRVRRRHDPDAGGEPIQDAAEVLPEVLDPIRMAPGGIRHVDEPAARVLASIVPRELGYLSLLCIPLVLRVQDQALKRVPPMVPKTAGQKLGERDFAAEPAYVLESADAQARVDDKVPLLADVRLRLDEEVIIPVRQCVPPRDAQLRRSLKVCGLAAHQPHETEQRADGGEDQEPFDLPGVHNKEEEELEEQSQEDQREDDFRERPPPSRAPLSSPHSTRLRHVSTIVTPGPS